MTTFSRIIARTFAAARRGFGAFTDGAVHHLAGIRSRTLSRASPSQSVKRPSYWIIQILPEGSGSSHSYRLKKRTAFLGIGGLVGLVGLTSMFLLGMLGRGDAIDELRRYRAENQELIASLDAMEGRSGRLGQALDDLAAREHRFRLVAGLPLYEPDVYEVGVGGPGGFESVGPGLLGVAPDLAKTATDVTLDLDQLLRRAELLSTSLGEAADSVVAKRDQFGRMPAIWPVLAEDSWISSSFSYSRLHPLLGYRRPHPGIDISAAEGSLVIAAGGGRVVFAGPERGYGRLVEIDHGDGYRSRYAHLARVGVRAGQTVSRGAVIGEVGRSGLTTGPNLHYEVLKDDRPVNPWNYLLDDASYRR